MSDGLAPARSSARSSRAGRRSRWSRAASSGTTPPKPACSCTCEWMTLLSVCRPSSTTATDVSSQLVSIPRVRLTAPPSLPTRWGGTCGSVAPRQQVPAQAAHVGLDALEVRLIRAAEAWRVNRVGPHHDRVLAVVGVVALAAADDLEPESLVHVHGVLVGRAHLEGDPLRAHVV